MVARAAAAKAAATGAAVALPDVQPEQTAETMVAAAMAVVGETDLVAAAMVVVAAHSGDSVVAPAATGTPVVGPLVPVGVMGGCRSRSSECSQQGRGKHRNACHSAGVVSKVATSLGASTDH